MSSFKFLEKRMVLWGHRCLVLMLSFSLVSCTHSNYAAMNSKDEIQRDPATVIKQDPAGFYLQLKKEPFPHYRPRRHRISGNVYGREYKERMKTERTGFVVYQCVSQEGTEDKCEAITEIVSLAEMNRKLESIDGANEMTLSMFLGAVGGLLLGAAGIILVPPSAPVAGPLFGTSISIMVAGITGSVAFAVKEAHNYPIGRRLENLQISEGFIYTKGNLVGYKNDLIRLTSQIIEDRR